MFIIAVPPEIIYFLSAMLTIWCIASLCLFWLLVRYIKTEYNKLVQIILFYDEQEKELEQEPDEKPSNLIMLHSDELGY